MNVFSHRIQVQSNYAIYAHLASLFTVPVCQAFSLNENIPGQNHAWHPLLTSCRSTAKRGCYAAGNAENPQALVDERAPTFSVIRIMTDGNPSNSSLCEMLKNISALRGLFFVLLAKRTVEGFCK